jgi:hypothetical protein
MGKGEAFWCRAALKFKRKIGFEVEKTAAGAQQSDNSSGFAISQHVSMLVGCRRR